MWVLFALALLGVSMAASPAARARRARLPARVRGEPTRELVELLTQIALSANLPAHFVLANADAETRFQPLDVDTRGRRRLPPGTIPERSIGIMGVNINPQTAAGRERLALLERLGWTVEDLLTDPVRNAAFWASYIIRDLQHAGRADLERRARAQGYRGDEVWTVVRAWLGSPRLDPEGQDARARRARMRPYLSKWRARLGASS